MAIDASIALQSQVPKFDDPLTVQAKRLQLSDLVGRQQVQQMQLRQAQREQQEQQTLSDLWRESGGDPTKTRELLATRGLGARIPAFDKAQGELAKDRVGVDEAKLKIAKQKLDIINASWSSLAANPQPSHQDAISVIAGLVQQGVLDQAHGAQMVQALPSRPEMLRPFLIQKGLEGMDAAKRIDLLLPKTDVRNMGGNDQVFSTDQLTGTVTPGATFAKSATPDAVMTDARTRAEGAANRANAVALANLRESGEDRRATAAREAAAEKLLNPTQKLKDATEAIDLINQAEPLLKDSTGSYSGWAVDKVAQFFGSATKGAVSAQQLKAIEGALVAKMPKMSGPQSDKDVQLYRQMAAVIGDETIPYAQKVAALGQVRTIQERYAGMTPGSSKPANAGAVAPESVPTATGWGIRRLP
jgi:hypothetical protein